MRSWLFFTKPSMHRHVHQSKHNHIQKPPTIHLGGFSLFMLQSLPMATPALKIQNITKTYKNGVVALKGIDLEIPEGDFFALLGPNGAGKTTIIGITTGLVTKSGGTVEVFGHNTDTETELAKMQIGLVGQEINFNPFEKPINIVVNQAGYYGIPRSIAIPRAEKILTDLGLGEKMHMGAMTLSGGMKRRLMIARALVNEPRFLILDEPTAGVDVELRRSMWEYLSGLSKKGLTILLTTHYLEEAEQLCKNVAIINKGEIVAHGTMKDVLEKHGSDEAKSDGFRGGKLEEVFLKLTSNNN